MRVFRMIAHAGAGVGFALTMAACAVLETSSRNLPLDLPGLAPGASFAALYAVQQVRVIVPDTLHVSERDGLYPTTDIVWRGDPAGNRRAQVADMFRTAAAQVGPGLMGGTPAIATLTLQRFHGVTEQVAALGGGVYAIRFLLTFTDPATGWPLTAPRVVEADLAAPAGVADERSLVIGHLRAVLAAELAGSAAI